MIEKFFIIKPEQHISLIFVRDCFQCIRPCIWECILCHELCECHRTSADGCSGTYYAFLDRRKHSNDTTENNITRKRQTIVLDKHWSLFVIMLNANSPSASYCTRNGCESSPETADFFGITSCSFAGVLVGVAGTVGSVAIVVPIEYWNVSRCILWKFLFEATKSYISPELKWWNALNLCTSIKGVISGSLIIFETLHLDER